MLQLVMELVFSVAVNGVVVCPGKTSTLHSVINSTSPYSFHTTWSDYYL